MNAHLVVLIVSENGNGHHVLPGSSADMAPFALEDPPLPAAPGVPCPRCGSGTKVIGYAQLSATTQPFDYLSCQRCQWCGDTRERLR